MSQYGYRYDRVLIEASRVLDSQFSDAVLQVSGAQLELLRNMTQYLNRRTTFVDTYHTGHYELPDDSDWDTILAIVANLEEELMGNENTLFGYKERWEETIVDTNAHIGTNLLETTAVPAGYVYVVQVVTTKHANRVNTQVKQLTTPTESVVLAHTVDAPIGVWQTLILGNVVLQEDDTIEGIFLACSPGDDIYLSVWGYKMKVPE